MRCSILQSIHRIYFESMKMISQWIFKHRFYCEKYLILNATDKKDKERLKQYFKNCQDFSPIQACSIMLKFSWENSSNFGFFIMLKGSNNETTKSIIFNQFGIFLRIKKFQSNFHYVNWKLSKQNLYTELFPFRTISHFSIELFHQIKHFEKKPQTKLSHQIEILLRK